MFSVFLSAALTLTGCTDTSVGRHNAAPDASITSHADGDEVYEGYTVTLRGSASDADNLNTDLIATWFVGGEEACSGAPTSDGITECDVEIGIDDSEVMLEVRDIEGAADSESISLTLVHTDTPEVTISTPTADGVYYSDLLVEFTGVVTDTEDLSDDLTVWWESSLGDDMSEIDVTPNTDGAITGFGYLSEGEHAIELFAEDLAGKLGSDSVILAVGPPNSSPLCEITAPTDSTTDISGTEVRFEGTVSDVDVPADWLMVAWSSDKDGHIGDSTPTSDGIARLAWSDLSVETHLVTMTVTDEVGATYTDSIYYTVEGDNDGDGFYSSEDCNDNDPAIYPFAGDVSGDGIDSDCDGIDCAAGSYGTVYFAVCDAFPNGGGHFADGVTYCTDHGYDGMAEIHSSGENIFVAELEPTSAPSLGATDISNEGTWVWNSGATWSFTYWQSNEPNNAGGNENCLHMRGSGTDSATRYTWNDAMCDPTTEVPTAGITSLACEVR